MRYRFFICDVFTDTRFGGNQLAVLPEASGLSERQMQQIAREFNFPETTFVFPPKAGQTRHVRIFTPMTEVPFAGHPNIGTAFVLATIGEIGAFDDHAEIIFEEAAGNVTVSVDRTPDATLRCELQAPQLLSFGCSVAPELAARALGLEVGDIDIGMHPPRESSVGLPFLLVATRDRETLQRARADIGVMEQLQADDITPDVLVYCRSDDDFDIRARMFAPLDGVPEDPATGSANCALAGLLAHYDSRSSAELSWRIAQGVEMGRPSVLDARAHKRAGDVVATWIGGHSVLVAEGELECGPAA